MPTLSWYPLHWIQLILDGERNFADVCDRAARWKISTLELYDGLLEPLGPLSPTAARQALDAAGIGVSVLLCAPDLASPQQTEREEQVKIMEQYLDTAALLGARAVRITPGIIHSGITRPDAVRLAAEHLQTLAEKAGERGLAVCVENVIQDSRWHAADVSAPAATFRSLLERLADSPYQVILNTGNPALVMTDTLSVLSAIPDGKLYGIHLSERSTIDGAHRSLGDEEMSWDPLREALHTRGFDGHMGILDGQAEGDGGTLRSLLWAREWLEGW